MKFNYSQNSLEELSNYIMTDLAEQLLKQNEQLQKENDLLYEELLKHRALIIVSNNFCQVIGNTNEFHGDNFVNYYGKTMINNVIAKLQICVKPIENYYTKHQIYFDGIKLLTLYKNDSLKYTLFYNESHMCFKCDNCEYNNDYE